MGIADVTIGPSDSTGATACATLSGFSRHWNEGPGAGHGHVQMTTSGGATAASGRQPCRSA
jgi:hypothetical protein